jgi:gluconate 5-dehydrogenase
VPALQPERLALEFLSVGGYKRGRKGIDVSTRLFDLTGRVALVTGSGGGLGLAVARGLGAAGAMLCLNGRNETKLAGAAEALAAEGIKVHAFAFDVTDPAAIDAGVGRIEAEVGPLDVLVNNAGIMRRAKLEEFKPDDWRAVLEANLSAAMFVAQRVARGMIQRRRGKIINICSLMSEVGRPTTGAYAAAKGGLKMLTRAMAVEWARHGIQINGIGPGYFETEMTAPLLADEKFNAWITARTPAGRWGKPQELVGPAVFLAGDASSFVNGQVLYVDGGVLAAL